MGEDVGEKGEDVVVSTKTTKQTGTLLSTKHLFSAKIKSTLGNHSVYPIRNIRVGRQSGQQQKTLNTMTVCSAVHEFVRLTACCQLKVSALMNLTSTSLSLNQKDGGSVGYITNQSI